jgi:hypothetical protein
MASTGLKPEKNPTLSTPVNSYGIHGYLYSARTTEWFVGKNENWTVSPTSACMTSGTKVNPPFATSTVWVIGVLLVEDAVPEEAAA